MDQPQLKPSEHYLDCARNLVQKFMPGATLVEKHEAIIFVLCQILVYRLDEPSKVKS